MQRPERIGTGSLPAGRVNHQPTTTTTTTTITTNETPP